MVAELNGGVRFLTGISKIVVSAFAENTAKTLWNVATSPKFNAFTWNWCWWESS